MKTATKKLSILLVAVICMVSMISMTVNAAITSTPLTLNSDFVTANLDTAGKEVYYTFTVPSDGKVTLDFQAWAKTKAWGMYTSDFTKYYFTQTLWNGTTTSPENASKTYHLSAGTYGIKIWDRSDGDYPGECSIRVKWEALNNTDIEPSDAFTSAMVLPASQQIKGALTLTDNLDFYKVSMPAEGPYKIDLINTLDSGNITIYRSDFTQVSSKNYYDGSEAAPATYSYSGTLPAGEYYIKISGLSTSDTGAYWITFKNTNPQSITLNKTSLTMKDNDEFQLTATVSPADAVSTDVVWSTTDYYIAYVDETGKVTARGVGVATITATSDVNDKVLATCKVIVKPAQVTGLSQSISLTKQTSTTISWYSTSGADGYRVYKYDTKKKKYVKYKDTTKTSLKVSKLKAEKSYKFKVAAYIKDGSKKIVGKQSAALKAYTAPKQLAATKITSVKRYKRTTYYNYITVKWNKVKGATGYKVYGKQPGGDWRLIVTTSSRSAKLYAGRGYTYQIKVCAYRKKNGLTTDGKFSKVKKYTSK